MIESSSVEVRKRKTLYSVSAAETSCSVHLQQTTVASMSSRSLNHGIVNEWVFDAAGDAPIEEPRRVSSTQLLSQGDLIFVAGFLSRISNQYPAQN